jgi:hypothetical protein
MLKKTLIFMSIILTTGVAFAADVPPEFQVDETASQMTEPREVRDDIDDFLSSKGFSEGLNDKNGKEIFIATGVNVIQAPRNSPAYMRSRVNSFDKAMMEAKRQMTEYIRISIQTEAVSDYSEGESPDSRKQKASKAAAAQVEPGMFEKTSALVNAKLDKLLEDEGVDMSKPVPEETLQKVLTSDVFEKFTKTVASARIVGMQSWKVFEQSPDGDKGEIGVIAVYSDKLHMMANALFGGKTSVLPQGAPREPIVDQIPKNLDVLLTTFGVQQKTDENGNLALVSFGQGVPRTNSKRSLSSAYDKAKMNAMSALRSFAGEIATVEAELNQFESVKEFENGMEEYQNEEYYRQKIKTQADALKFSGIHKIHRWKSTHPLTNQQVVGVVIYWSPDSAAQAGAIGNKMAKEPQKKKKASNASQSNTIKAGSNQKGFYKAQGAAADENSF